MEFETQIYKVVEDVNERKIDRLNRLKKFKYGYNEEFDFVCISRTGKIGEIYDIQGLKVALPLIENPHKRSNKRAEQYWEAFEYPKELSRIKTLAQWNTYPDEFKEKWSPYIEEEFKRREHGFSFKNNGVPTYIAPTHYMYLQWSKTDVGKPDFREANRILYIFWEACKADPRSFGMCYLKIRRSGASFMAAAEAVNIGTWTEDARIGVLSKTGSDAKKLFTDKIVPMSINYPFFFKPIQDGMNRPKTELAYRVPSDRMTLRKLTSHTDGEEEELYGLNTTIDWKNTGDNSYDGEKLVFLIHDESGKWEKPDNILNNWRITKTCLRLGRKIIGKCMMVSTSNALDKGGENFKKIYTQSSLLSPKPRTGNGQTVSGLYSLFIPMEWNTEGYIDIYGNPVMRTPKKPVLGVDGEMIDKGAIDWWEAEVEGYKNSGDSDGLNEFYRQFPRTEDHAFRDEAKDSLFDLTKLYDQIDYNGDMSQSPAITRGNFRWKGGRVDGEVEFIPNANGRFQVAWIPPKELQNKVILKAGRKFPANEHIGAFGLDSYDISMAGGNRGSKASAHGQTKRTAPEGVPKEFFFLRYNARPPKAEIMFEDILMALVFYGMPVLAENNKPRFLYYLKRRGYRGFSLERPDKLKSQLSPVEKEIGGVPNSSEKVIQDHAAAIESFITDCVGILENGEYGKMYFNETLKDWTRFNISKRTVHDDSISSGLAIMANNKMAYHPVMERQKVDIDFGFAQYTNDGSHSKIIKRN